MVFGYFNEPQGEPQRARPSFSAKDKEFLFERQKGKCNGCAVKFPMRNMTVDHIKPFSKGGSDKPSNLQLLCNSCNSMKGNGTQAQLKKRLVEKGVIKPATTAKTATKTATGPAKKSATPAKPKPKSTTKRQPARPKDPFEEFVQAFRL